MMCQVTGAFMEYKKRRLVAKIARRAGAQAQGYRANLVSEWLPSLDGVVERLKRGARVTDIGCGHGASTIVMAQAFPKSSFVDLDYHNVSIATARRRAAEQGVTGEVKAATEFRPRLRPHLLHGLPARSR
jgi:tRNA G46 methylase TrmB